MLLRTLGLAGDAMTILEQQGWDAFLRHQAALRRARRRLPWHLRKADASCEQSLASQQAMEGGGSGMGSPGRTAAEAAASEREGEAGQAATQPQALPSRLARLVSGRSMLATLLEGQSSVRGPLVVGEELFMEPASGPDAL